MRKKDTLVKVETYHPFFDYNCDIETSTLYIGDDINEDAASQVIKYLAIVDRVQRPITIYMCSSGGSYYDGIAIYDRIKYCQNDTTIIVYGQCFSMASIIFQAATLRVMMPNSCMLIHDGIDAFEGNPNDLDSLAEESKRIRNQSYQIYSERSGLPTDQIKDLCKFDTYLSPERAIALGLADVIYSKTP